MYACMCMTGWKSENYSIDYAKSVTQLPLHVEVGWKAATKVTQNKKGGSNSISYCCFPHTLRKKYAEWFLFGFNRYQNIVVRTLHVGSPIAPFFPDGMLTRKRNEVRVGPVLYNVFFNTRCFLKDFRHPGCYLAVWLNSFLEKNVSSFCNIQTKVCCCQQKTATFSFDLTF